MRVIISAGGTGGHIYPALAIINKIKEKEPKSEFLFIGTHNRMEKDLIPKYGIPYKSLTIYGFNRKNIFSNFKSITCFFKSIGAAKKIINDFKPDIVIGVGGYVTAPVIYAAKKLGYKTLIHEQNSSIGLSNKFLLKYADIVAVSFKSSVDLINNSSKVIFTGNPVSEGIINKTVMDKTLLGLKKNKKLVVIVMGSLGSIIINQEMKEVLPLFNDKDYEILFITGQEYFHLFDDLKVSSNIKIVSYVDDLSSLLKATDLIISRAGATTISEIIALCLPSILIPSPYVTANHQYKNAMDLVDKNASLMIEEKDLDGKKLVSMVDDLLNNKEKYDQLKSNLSHLSTNDSSTHIYNLIYNLIDGRNNNEKHNKRNKSK